VGSRDQSLVREATQPGPAIVRCFARLSELLFMEVLRWQLSFMSLRGVAALLAGLNIASGPRSLCLHAEPARSWTVEELAQRAAISRAGLQSASSNSSAKRQCNI